MFILFYILGPKLIDIFIFNWDLNFTIFLDENVSISMFAVFDSLLNSLSFCFILCIQLLLTFNQEN